MTRRSHRLGRRARVLLLSAPLVASACSDAFGPGACTLEAVAGITVDLRAENGAALPSDDAEGRAVDGNDVVELQPFLNQLVGAWERAGTYTVTVEKPGYAAWVREGVRVEDGDCHVVPVRLEAVLSPEP